MSHSLAERMGGKFKFLKKLFTEGKGKSDAEALARKNSVFKAQVSHEDLTKGKQFRLQRRPSIS